MSSNLVRFQEILNQALFTYLTQKLANPPLKSGSSFPNIRDPLFQMIFQLKILRKPKMLGYFKQNTKICRYVCSSYPFCSLYCSFPFQCGPKMKLPFVEISSENKSKKWIFYLFLHVSKSQYFFPIWILIVLIY